MSLTELINSNLVAGLVGAVIGLIGVVLANKASVGNAKKEFEKVLKDYDADINKRVYASSKRMNMEYDYFDKLGQKCGEVNYMMQRLYPVHLSTYQINYKEKPTLDDMAEKIKDLETQIYISRGFIPDNIIQSYEELLKIAESFFTLACRHHDAYDDTEDDHVIKKKRRNEAYLAREKFENAWKDISINVKAYLTENEK